MKWYSGSVLRGKQDGRTIGFPTVNLDPSILNEDISEIQPGIYASQVRVHDEVCLGALYIGPRLVKNETHTVLEIFILDFDQEIYDESIEFTVEKFIRGVENFTSMDEMMIRIKQDVKEVREFFKA
ncbi:MAG: riboflavin kinase [Patescibacteria group bacterium]